MLSWSKNAVSNVKKQGISWAKEVTKEASSIKDQIVQLGSELDKKGVEFTKTVATQGKNLAKHSTNKALEVTKEASSKFKDKIVQLGSEIDKKGVEFTKTVATQGKNLAKHGTNKALEVTKEASSKFKDKIVQLGSEIDKKGVEFTKTVATQGKNLARHSSNIALGIVKNDPTRKIANKLIQNVANVQKIQNTGITKTRCSDAVTLNISPTKEEEEKEENNIDDSDVGCSTSPGLSKKVLATLSLLPRPTFESNAEHGSSSGSGDSQSANNVEGKKASIKSLELFLNAHKKVTPTSVEPSKVRAKWKKSSMMASLVTAAAKPFRPDAVVKHNQKIFRHISRKAWTQLSTANVKSQFESGDVIIEEDTLPDHRDAVFIIIFGTVEVTSRGRHVATLYENDSFGESVVARLSALHLFTVTAVETTQVSILKNSVIKEILTDAERDVISQISVDQIRTYNWDLGEQILLNLDLFRGTSEEFKTALAKVFDIVVIPAEGMCMLHMNFIAYLCSGSMVLEINGFPQKKMDHGSVFGETSFLYLGDTPCNTEWSIVAETDCVFLTLKYHDLQDTAAKFPADANIFLAAKNQRHVSMASVSLCVNESSLFSGEDVEFLQNVAEFCMNCSKWYSKDDRIDVLEDYICMVASGSVMEAGTFEDLGREPLEVKKFEPFGVTAALRLADHHELEEHSNDLVSTSDNTEVAYIHRFAIISLLNQNPNRGGMLAKNAGIPMKTMDYQTHLPYFKYLGIDTKLAVNNLKWHQGFAGQTLYLQGDKGDKGDFTIILASGECEIFINRVLVSTLKGPCAIDEMATLGFSTTRRGSAILKSTSAFAIIHQETYRRLTKQTTRTSICFTTTPLVVHPRRRATPNMMKDAKETFVMDPDRGDEVHQDRGNRDRERNVENNPAHGFITQIDNILSSRVFASCCRRFIDRVVQLVELRAYMPSETILTMGEVATEQLLILAGETKSVICGASPPRTESESKIDCGAVCGELSLVEEVVRKATVTAKTLTVCAIFHREILVQLCKIFAQDPVKISNMLCSSEMLRSPHLVA